MYSLQLEKLRIKKMGLETMSSRQIYMIQSPVRLYLWLGRDVDVDKKCASLRIMKSFLKAILKEDMQYEPGYNEKSG